MRPPAVAGQFYPADPKRLKQALKTAYTHRLGPGKEPTNPAKGRGRIKGLIVPHAGYTFSGHIAAHAYAALTSDGLPDTAIILGPNHTGRGSGVALTDEDHETPLGPVAVDKPLAKALFTDIIDNTPAAHAREHSIEVQLPFLKQLNPELKFVPVAMMMQDPATAARVGQAIAEAVEELDLPDPPLIIASTDFSHYEPASVAAQKDRIAYERIADYDIEGLYREVAAHSISMCGVGPVAATLHACAALGASQARLLKYATSGDVHDMPDVVGYAAMVVS